MSMHEPRMADVYNSNHVPIHHTGKCMACAVFSWHVMLCRWWGGCRSRSANLRLRVAPCAVLNAKGPWPPRGLLQTPWPPGRAKAGPLCLLIKRKSAFLAWPMIFVKTPLATCNSKTLALAQLYPSLQPSLQPSFQPSIHPSSPPSNTHLMIRDSPHDQCSAPILTF